MMDAAFKQQLKESLEPLERRAQDNGRSVSEEIDELAKQGRPFTPEERGAISAFFLSRYSERQPSLTLDEIREGLM